MAENKVSIQVGTSDIGVVGVDGHPLSLPVDLGQQVAFVTLNAATTNATGVTMDAGSSHNTLTAIAVGTGTLAGTLTIEGSMDNTTFVSTGATVALTAAATVTATSTLKALRYYRVSLSGASGAGTVTCKIMANS